MEFADHHSKRRNKMSSCKHFTMAERETSMVLLGQGREIREIARALGRSPSSVSRELRRNKKMPKELRKTFTVDNGTEFYDHPLLTELTGMNVYFCDPFSSWQRGSNENTNGLLRQFFPKGASLADLTDQRLQFVVDLIPDTHKMLKKHFIRESYH